MGPIYYMSLQEPMLTKIDDIVWCHAVSGELNFQLCFTLRNNRGIGTASVQMYFWPKDTHAMFPYSSDI